MNRKSREDNDFDKAEVNRENGLNVSYDKSELNQFLPHLMDEIENKEKSMKINSIDYDIEGSEKKEAEENPKEPSCLDNLSNPRAIDFIRRCSTKKEAIEILDYLLEREELSQDEYNKIKKRIEKKEGLKSLINESGGFKEPGYYIRKYYYNKNTKSEKEQK